jgi:hypothetical protein
MGSQVSQHCASLTGLSHMLLCVISQRRCLNHAWSCMSPAQHAQCLYLVTRKSDQRRDDHSEAAPTAHEGWELECQRLACDTAQRQDSWVLAEYMHAHHTDRLLSAHLTALCQSGPKSLFEPKPSHCAFHHGAWPRLPSFTRRDATANTTITPTPALHVERAETDAQHPALLSRKPARNTRSRQGHTCACWQNHAAVLST